MCDDSSVFEIVLCLYVCVVYLFICCYIVIHNHDTSRFCCMCISFLWELKFCVNLLIDLAGDFFFWRFLLGQSEALRDSCRKREQKLLGAISIF
jgi:hypothetical protein